MPRRRSYLRGVYLYDRPLFGPYTVSSSIPLATVHIGKLGSPKALDESLDVFLKVLPKTLKAEA